MMEPTYRQNGALLEQTGPDDSGWLDEDDPEVCGALSGNPRGGCLPPRKNLRGAALQDACLAGVDLQGANLDGADLEGADLTGANLRQASLRGAHLWGATLRDAQLHGADLTGAELYLAVLKGARYDAETRWPDGFDPAARGAVLAG